MEARDGYKPLNAYTGRFGKELNDILGLG